MYAFLLPIAVKNKKKGKESISHAQIQIHILIQQLKQPEAELDEKRVRIESRNVIYSAMLSKQRNNALANRKPEDNCKELQRMGFYFKRLYNSKANKLTK